MSRKGERRLTPHEKQELWRKWEGNCWRCGLPIDKHKRGVLHWGHIVDRALGGSDEPKNRAPEHSHCNLGHAAAVGNALAAKVKRVARRDLERPEPKMKLSRKMNGDVCRWNPETRRHDILVRRTHRGE